jgi:spore photoproduct lyase
LLISKLYIDREVADNPLVHSIISRLNLPAEIVQSTRDVYKHISDAKDPIKKAKEILFLTQNKGPFIKKCPGTRDYICCGYKILHIGTFCTMDCSYCILQAYFHPPLLQYFVNQNRLFVELDQVFEQKQICRIGTGEYTDSLIWDSCTDLPGILTLKFSEQSHAVLELKTKTTRIQSLQNLPHRRKTILAWSLNTNRIIDSEERDTALLSARLKAAAKCESWGYPLAFHFDPLLIYPGCEAEYQKVIEQLFSHVSPENIVWISLGTFRFIPTLKHIVQQRFLGSKIVYGEFIRGLDNKMRYFKPLRIRLYQNIVSYIRDIAPSVVIYFCMEDEQVWEQSLGFIPSQRGGLAHMLNQSAADKCGLG